MMFLIRPATEADYPALAEIFLVARRQAFGWCDPESFQLADFATQTEGEVIQLAMDEQGTPVGFMAIWQPESFVHHLYVDPRHHRQGIGSLLLESLASWLPKPHRLKCLVANQGALAFYRSHGWQERDRGVDASGDYWVMEKGVD